MQEKRSFKRFERKVPARLQSLEMDIENSKAQYLFTRDICAGGAFISTNNPLPPGTSVLVEIALPIENSLHFESENHCFVKVQGHVLRCEPAGMAISFQKNYHIEFKELPAYVYNAVTTN